MAISDKEYAILSNAVYRDKDYISPIGEPPAGFGFTSIKTISDDTTGLYAEAFRKEPGNEVVIAFRGTNNKLNIMSDIELFAGGEA